jgi:hypothetical protein
VNLTVYNQNFAIVKERRLMQLGEGAGIVKFPGVAATIVPESVQFSSLRPGGAKVLEQNYEFDLLSADKLLHKYIDREISVVGRDGSLTEGTLLAAEGNHLVMASRGGIELIPRRNNIKDIRFSSLPEGLLLRPTLVWKVRAQQPGEHLVKIAYAATGIKWRVDYRAVASADETTLDVAGWVTIDNRTGTTFKDAGLKLLAGDVHLVPKKSEKRAASARGSFALGLQRVPAFEEKAFGEYHLYTLGRRTTLANAQTKQIELLKVGKIPVAKVFLYRPDFRHRLLKILKATPTIVDITLDRAAVIPEIAAASTGLLASFGVADRVILEAIFGEFSPSGKLPIELPSSMDAVRAQMPDVPFDSEDPLFGYGVGLQYETGERI